MATKKTTRRKSTRKRAPLRRRIGALTPARAWRLLRRAFLLAAGGFLFLVVACTVVDPVFTPYMLAERLRQGGIERDWVDLDEMVPDLPAAVVAAEDANFCRHWGFDMAAIRAAIDQGGTRGASTISQQVVKNLFLWHGRSWLRKALEAAMTPVVELVWSKRRILEVYLNIAEFGPGVFGVEAAARHHFGVSAADLDPQQAARLAVALPDPKDRNPARLSGFLRKRAAQVADGAATIRADGRADCFED